MVRRTVTALLWLLAVWAVGNALSLYAGVPSLTGPALGLAVGAFVWWDPARRLWTPRPSPAARRRLADLARVPAAASAVEVRRETETARG